MSAQRHLKHLQALLQRFARGCKARLRIVETRRARRGRCNHDAILHAVESYNASHAYAGLRRCLVAASFACAIITLGTPAMVVFASLGAAILWSLSAIRRPVDLALDPITRLAPKQLLVMLAKQNVLDAETRFQLCEAAHRYGGIPLWFLLVQSARLQQLHRALNPELQSPELQALREQREPPRDAGSPSFEPATTIDLHGMLARQSALGAQTQAHVAEPDATTSSQALPPKGER